MLRRILYDALDRSDDIAIVLQQTGPSANDIIVAAANDAFCRAIGRTIGGLIGQSFASLIAQEAAAQCAEILHASQEHRSICTELLCNRPSGSPLWLWLRLMPAGEASPGYCVLLGRDISETLQARRQHEAIQGLLLKVFLSVATPVAIVSDTGLIHMANPALYGLLGHPMGSIVGKPSTFCIAPDALPAALAARARQFEDGHDYTLVTRLLRADGSELPAEFTAIMVQREDLRRFRILTILPRQDAAPAPVSVHVAGKIKLIGLEAVKQALGPRWAALAARAMDSAEHIIRRRCGAHDSWSRTADCGYLICFPDASEDEAALRASAIAQEIRAHLIGVGESESTATVSAIAAAVEVPHGAGRTADMLVAAIGERLNSRLAEIVARARETLDQAVKSARCRLEPVRSRSSRRIVAHFARLPLQQEQQVLAAYSTLPMNERQAFDFDCLVLGVAADQAISEIAEGSGLLVLVNVNFEVFLDRQRTERYVAACEALDHRLRERLILVLSSLPRDVPKRRVLDCVMRLRPFCHGIGYQSDNMEGPSVEFSLLSAAIVILQDKGAPVDMPRLARLVDDLHTYQARVLVRHVTSWATAKSLAQLPVDLVSLVQDERDAGPS